MKFGQPERNSIRPTSAWGTRDAGKKVITPLNMKGDGVNLKAIYVFASVPIYRFMEC
jgi:hypothetical protein